MAEKTFFAPPERLGIEQARVDSRALSTKLDLQLLLKAVPECAAILDEHRQILLANEALLDLLSEEDFQEILGSRPGEAVGCIHAWDLPAGCGTGETCRYCGAAAAIVQTLETGEKATHECRITVENETETEWLDLLVAAVPIDVEGRGLILLTLTDISDAKRRRGLEKIFFHDVLNSATALFGLLEMVRDYEEIDVREQIDYLADLGGRLVDEICAQRDLLAAESGELNVQPRLIEAGALLVEASSQFRRETLEEGKSILVREGQVDVELVTDQRLLLRVVTNMLKNALEATGDGGVVTAGAEKADGRVRVWVRNPGAMTREVQLQVFQRSFSTRGAGRGLGTYSMKLIGERYLKGEVSFTSDERDGTEFSISLPESTVAPGRDN